MGKHIAVIILAIASGLAYLGSSGQATAMVSKTGSMETELNGEVGEHTPSCNSNILERDSRCQAIEQSILASTLRIELSTWIIYVEGEGYTSYYSDGHGTVIDDRHLLTHNHFDVPLSALMADTVKREQATVTLHTADGQELWQGPLTAMEVAFADSETLLLAFQDEGGRGLFGQLGVPSVELSHSPETAVEAGQEVAQINWDRKRAYVQWTKAMSITKVDGTPALRLSDCIALGSSGGGLFVAGIHVANNWSRAYTCDHASGGDAQYGSTTAFNSPELLAVVN